MHPGRVPPGTRWTKQAAFGRPFSLGQSKLRLQGMQATPRPPGLVGGVGGAPPVQALGYL